MAEKKISPWVKAALDWGPLIVFFIAFNRLKDGTYTILGTDYSGFVVATALFIPLIAATTIIWLRPHIYEIIIIIYY